MSYDEVIPLFLFERVRDVSTDVIVLDELWYGSVDPQKHVCVYGLSKLEFESHDGLS